MLLQPIKPQNSSSRQGLFESVCKVLFVRGLSSAPMVCSFSKTMFCWFSVLLRQHSSCSQVKQWPRLRVQLDLLLLHFSCIRFHLHCCPEAAAISCNRYPTAILNCCLILPLCVATLTVKFQPTHPQVATLCIIMDHQVQRKYFTICNNPSYVKSSANLTRLSNLGR